MGKREKQQPPLQENRGPTRGDLLRVGSWRQTWFVLLALWLPRFMTWAASLVFLTRSFLLGKMVLTIIPT